MKAGIMSDSHDNRRALRQAVALFNREQVDLVVHAGDYRAPAWAEELLALKAELVAVFGNMDVEKADVKTAFCEIIPHIQDPPLCVEIGDNKIAVTHNLEDTRDRIPDDSDIIIHGHLHRSEVRCEAGRLYINPGMTQSRVAILDTDTMTCRFEVLAES